MMNFTPRKIGVLIVENQKVDKFTTKAMILDIKIEIYKIIQIYTREIIRETININQLIQLR